MRLAALNELFERAHPGGHIEHGRRSGVLKVVFQAGGRVYNYRETVVGLAERLDLIPEFDMVAEARRMRGELRMQDEAIGPLGVMDTLRHLMPDDYLEYERIASDAYGRERIRCWISEFPEWLHPPHRNGG